MRRTRTVETLSPAAFRRAAIRHSGLSLAIALGLFAPLGHAQEAADAPASESGTLDTIKVTARKREETLQDVPVAVTAFTPDTLD